MISAESVSGCSSHRTGCLFHTLYCLLLLWSREMHGLSDFSNYLFRIINSHSAQAHDGDLLLLTCPRHSSISVQSAFYGPHKPLKHCSASTALQKMLSECQGHRNCQVLVHHHLFGHDPCPGTLKHLHVSYSCKPTEHKNRTRCEGDRMLLHCKYPKLLNIYSAIYGRELGTRGTCLTEEGQSPPFGPPFIQIHTEGIQLLTVSICFCASIFMVSITGRDYYRTIIDSIYIFNTAVNLVAKCSYYGAIDVVKGMCYGKQRCLLAVDDEHFRNPCAPGVKKYLTVLYSCVPQSLFREADPNFFKTTSVPDDTTKTENFPHVRDSRFPGKNAIIVSNSLMAYGYIAENAEMAGLLFISSVCLGLLIVLLVISVRLTCTRRLDAACCLTSKKDTEEPKGIVEQIDTSDDNDDDDDDELEPLIDLSMMSELGRKVYCWEEPTYTTEAAELMERLERREMIIQEIRMNSYFNGNSCAFN